MRVCSAWRAMVIEISVEYLIVYSDKDLKYLLKRLENSKPATGKSLGEWTLRIDLKIIGPYSVKRVVRLLRCAPNLLVFTNQNGRLKRDVKRIPNHIIKALMVYGKKLRRIDFLSMAEAPSFTDLTDISRFVRELQSLRINCVSSYPTRDELVAGVRIPLPMFPKLKTLSLGLIPEAPVAVPENYAVTWDPLMMYLGMNPAQLPELERLEVEIFPQETLSFFHIHGAKLRMFRTATWSAATILPTALELCPNLESLVLSHSSEPLELPTYHPTLQRICIMSAVEDFVKVPQRVFAFAVLMPLDTLLMSVEKMVAPSLVELRVRNTGAFSDLIEHAGWLRSWWRRWNIHGVHFHDKVGISYENVTDEGERLLDLVRE